MYEDYTHLFLPYQVEYSSNEYKDSGNISLKKNKLTQRVVELCAHEINFNKLKDILCSDFQAPEITVNEVDFRRFLNHRIQN